MTFPDPLAWGVTPMIPSSNRFFRRFHRWKPAGKLIFWAFPPVETRWQTNIFGLSTGARRRHTNILGVSTGARRRQTSILGISTGGKPRQTGFLGGFFRRWGLPLDELAALAPFLQLLFQADAAALGDVGYCEARNFV